MRAAPCTAVGILALGWVAGLAWVPEGRAEAPPRTGRWG